VRVVAHCRIGKVTMRPGMNYGTGSARESGLYTVDGLLPDEGRAWLCLAGLGWIILSEKMVCARTGLKGTTPGGNINQHDPYQLSAGPTGLELDEYECRLPSGEVSASEPGSKTMRLVKKSYRAAQNRHEAVAIAMTDSCGAIGQLHCRDLSGKFEFGLAPQ
jgi:hypothetical protein